MIEDIGLSVIIGEDEVFLIDHGTARRYDVPCIPIVVGEEIRDWSVVPAADLILPMTETFEVIEEPRVIKHLWPFKEILANRVVSGSATMRASGRRWFDVRRLSRDKHRTQLSIAFAFVATHNHFVFDHGGKVFKQSAPIIKLPANASKDHHIALLSWLNSSTSCFWMKQVCFPKMSGTNLGDVRGQGDRIAYEFSAAAVGALPVPATPLHIASLARRIMEIATERAAYAPGAVLAQNAELNTNELRTALSVAAERDELLFQRMVALQEEIDWSWYVQFGLAPSGVLPSIDCMESEAFRLRPEGRPFLATATPPVGEEHARLWRVRRELMTNGPLRIIEDAMHKRPWFGVQGVFHRDAWTYEERAKEAMRDHVLDMIERVIAYTEESFLTPADVVRELFRRPRFDALAELLTKEAGIDLDAFVAQKLTDDSIPYLAALRHTDTGLAKRARWEHTWALQRREDAGDTTVGDIPVPPKYDHEDYREARYWSLRGKLDVPRERFIAYPGAELDARAPVFGWAGWNHLQRARALAALYQRRKTDDGWDRDRLRPLLAGLQELLPWLKQWHNEPDAELDGLRQGDVWGEFLEGERAALGWSEDDLRAWRPSAPARKERAKKAPKAKAAKAEEAE